MNTIYLLSATQEFSDVFDTFATDSCDLRQIALDNYSAHTTYGVHIEVRPPDKQNVVRISEGGFVYAEYHIFKLDRVVR